MKRFNTRGTCRPNEHYMVDITERLEIMRGMVVNGDYFCINRGRQYGKTTTLNNLKTYLEDAGYCVFSISSSNPQLPSRNDIELKEKRVDAEKDAQSGGNRHKGA